MENASKALIMAGSVLIALMIIGALLLMFNSLTSYQDTNTQGEREAQVIEFNNQYETYNRDDVRGSDVISLINRIIDYNARKNAEGYTEMQIEININDVTKFKYDNNSEGFIRSKYTQNNLTELVGTINNKKSPKGLEEKYNESYIRKLSSNISNIIDGDDQKATKKIEEILPKKIDDYDGLEQIKSDTLIYYQYSQFKRAHFKCTKTEYDEKTGRIINMQFEFTGKFN